MTKTYQPLFSDAYLRVAYAYEFSAFHNSEAEAALIKQLQNWQGRAKNLTETQEEAQISTLTDEIDALDADIIARESELNEIIYSLYGLTDEERRIVER